MELIAIITNFNIMYYKTDLINNNSKANIRRLYNEI
jgi:hypothetical protein